jgi:hypothetical protein
VTTQDLPESLKKTILENPKGCCLPKKDFTVPLMHFISEGRGLKRRSSAADFWAHLNRGKKAVGLKCFNARSKFFQAVCCSGALL